MKNKTIKTAFRRGFTLIELMIVIVILGILMGTILPRLTGGQARARDTGRIADLSNIKQAISMYNVDYGSFPALAGECLIPSAEAADGSEDAKILKRIESYLTGNRIPSTKGDKVLATVDGAPTCADSYYYETFTWRQVDDGAFVLGARMNTFQLANTLTGTDSVGGNKGFIDISAADDDALQTFFGAIEYDMDAREAATPMMLGYAMFGTQ